MSFVRKVASYLINPRASLPTPSRPEEEDFSGDEGAPLGQLQSPLTWRDVVYNPPLLLGTVIVVGLIAVILFGPLWTDHDPYITAQSVLPHFDTETNTFVRLPFPPSAEHPLGTDNWGNDMLSLILYGARVTLITGAYITLLRVVLGAIMGSIAGWNVGEMPDRVVLGLIGLVSSFPMLLSGLILLYALGLHQGAVVFIIALSLIGWTEIAQYVRGEILVIRQMPYIEGARMTGLTDGQIVVRHILPNLLPQLLVFSCLEMGAVLILVAELGFLGVFIGGGVLFTMDPVFAGAVSVPEVPEWGALISQGVRAIRANSHLVLAPALAFFISVVGFNAFGEGLRRLLDKSSLHMAFLLQKRTFVGLVIFLLISAYILDYTGPEFSYQRVAEAFEGERAEQHVDVLAEIKAEESTLASTHQAPSATAEYIKDKFVEYELQMGWKPQGTVGRSYFMTTPTDQGENTMAVVGFMPGYDFELSTELVVLLAPYQEEHIEEAGGVALMLEMARLWQEQQVDPRRSLLFVAWNQSAATPEEMESFLENPENFSALPVPSRGLAQPAALFQFDSEGTSDTALLVDSHSDQRLLRLFTRSANAVDVPVEKTASDKSLLLAGKLLPSLAFRWTEPDTTGAVDQERLEAAGEVLGLTMLKVVRQPVY